MVLEGVTPGVEQHRDQQIQEEREGFAFLCTEQKWPNFSFPVFHMLNAD